MNNNMMKMKMFVFKTAMHHAEFLLTADMHIFAVSLYVGASARVCGREGAKVLQL